MLSISCTCQDVLVKSWSLFCISFLNVLMLVSDSCYITCLLCIYCAKLLAETVSPLSAYIQCGWMYSRRKWWRNNMFNKTTETAHFLLQYRYRACAYYVGWLARCDVTVTDIIWTNLSDIPLNNCMKKWCISHLWASSDRPLPKYSSHGFLNLKLIMSGNENMWGEMARIQKWNPMGILPSDATPSINLSQSEKLCPSLIPWLR